MREFFCIGPTRLPTEAMLVWFASISPLTRWFVVTYGERRVSATWMDAGPHGMKLASWRSRMRRSDWCTCYTNIKKIRQWHRHRGPGKLGAYVGGIDVTLNNVQDRDVACRLARYGRNHPVFGLQKTAHHVQHSRTPDRLGLVVELKRAKKEKFRHACLLDAANSLSLPCRSSRK